MGARISRLLGVPAGWGLSALRRQRGHLFPWVPVCFGLGIALYFAAHLFINTGVNLGLIPMTGLTLPLLSTGGSSLLTSFLALGLALGLAARVEPSLDEDAFKA